MALQHGIVVVVMPELFQHKFNTGEHVNAFILRKSFAKQEKIVHTIMTMMTMALFSREISFHFNTIAPATLTSETRVSETCVPSMN